MHYESQPEILRLLVAERHESLRREAALARVRREARAERSHRRRARRLERARRAEHRPHLVAPPPAIAE